MKNITLSIAILFMGLQAHGQGKPCVFCEIVKGTRQANQVVYRDHLVVAFMNHAPANPGHILVVPVVHAKEITEVPDSTARQMMSVGRKIATAMRKTDIKCEGFNFRINSGEAAGQTVFHSHLHVIPRFKDEKLSMDEHHTLPPEELEVVAKKIRNALPK
ncbi:MAG: HIT family protein [Bacteroidetes bacterium]|nr:HIT family protein [Bacteroidota bacterium]